jgi:rSAM/selenodomain-associated transferase 1
VHVLLKAPRPGAVKTRLAAAIGDTAAVALYRELAARTLAVVRETGWPCTVWYAPRDAERECRAWLGDEARLRAQPDGDLGARMAHAVASEPPGRATLLLGGDCPGVTAALLRAASSALERVPAVVGPSVDGGYWLLGVRTPPPALFDGMAWSTPGVLAETRRRLAAAGVGWEELATLRDVDTVDDARAEGLVG